MVTLQRYNEKLSASGHALHLAPLNFPEDEKEGRNVGPRASLLR